MKARQPIIIAGLALFAALFAFLQVCHRYSFFFAEQNHLFLWSRYYVESRLFEPGGAVTLISEFLMQFFAFPFGGAGITAALIMLAGLTVDRLLRRLAPSVRLEIFTLLPVVALLFLHLDNSWTPAGTVAFILTVAALLLTVCLTATIHLQTETGAVFCRFGMVITIALFLYLLAGAAFALYLVGFVAIELLFGQSRMRFLSPLLLILIPIAGRMAIDFSVAGEYRLALLPDEYYMFRAKPKTVVYLLWLSLPVLILLARILKINRLQGRRFKIIFAAVYAVVVAFLFFKGLPTHDDHAAAFTKKLDYCCRTGDWATIRESCRGRNCSTIEMCYLNMALANDGMLADSAFRYSQHPSGGLIPTTGMNAQSYFMSALLSEVYFTINHIALAQRNAFEAYNFTAKFGNPRVLKRLVETNIIYGAWPVAEKYIAVLEQTLAYRDWATAQRRFLRNDSAVMADPFYSDKRRSLPPIDHLSVANGLSTVFQYIAQCNPEHSQAIEYLGMTFLLNKNLESFRKVIDRYFATKVLPALPLSFQEAMMLIDNSPEAIAHYRISPEVANNYAAFAAMVESEQSNPALPRIAAARYGSTYWFYNLFKQLKSK
jgi:hypothetical protein